MRAYVARPVCPLPADTATLFGVPLAVAVAEKVTGLPLIPEPVTVAVRLFVPAEPNVQVIELRPLASVVAVGWPTLPPPLVTANCTTAPLTALLNVSRTSTTTGLARAVPAGPVWAFPDWACTDLAFPATAVAENTTGVLVPVAALAVAWFRPVAVPSRQGVLASPPAPVVVEVVVTLPPPAVTVKPTDAFPTGWPVESWTSITMAAGISCPTVSVWLSPETFRIWAGTCATLTVTLPFTDEPDAVASICVVPEATAATFPVEDTVAIPVLFEDQVTLAPLIVAPFASLTVAVSCWVEPTAPSVTADGAISTAAGVAGPELLLQRRRSRLTAAIAAVDREKTVLERMDDTIDRAGPPSKRPEAER